ncbi:MAG: rhodanese-like domain-containing protein [Bacteroidetes bacterium]|nr:rhodanese-like domain-containing protein [Bacteroidota bacterium]
MAIFGTFFQSGKTVVNLDSLTFESQMKSENDSVLLDVRTEDEFYEERIPNSKLINLMDPEFQTKISNLDKSKSYYVYCRSGNRSYHAGNMMMKMGFEKVYNLASGIIGWHGETESE